MSRFPRARGLGRRAAPCPSVSSSASAVGVLLLSGLLGAQSVAPPPGLVGWWDADRTSTFDPTGGAFLLDVLDPSSCRARGSYQPLQPVVKEPGLVGEAIRFDNGAYVLIDGGAPGGPALFDGTNGFTVEFWMRSQSQPTGQLVVLVEKSHDCQSGWAFQGDGVDLGFFVVPPALGSCPAIGVGTAALASADKPFNGAWHHVAGTYDPADTGQQVKFYVDGVPLGTGDTQGAAIGTNNRSVLLGRWWQGGRQYHGLLDEVSFYDRALSEAEIQLIHGAGSDGKTKPPFGIRRREDARVVTPSVQGTFEYQYATVDIDGDVIAAADPAADRPGSPSAGVVNVFRRTSTGWTFEAQLERDPMEIQQRFGQSVAVQGDEILGGELNGNEVWMFKYRPTHPGGPWVRTRAFFAQQTSFGHFTERLARSGEVVIVGSPRAGTPPFPVDAGAVQIWRRTVASTDPTVEDTWQLEAAIASPTGENGGYFGGSVAVHDGFALVGAPLIDDQDADAGGAWVYRYDGVNWVLDARLQRTDAGPDGQFQGDQFGASVALGTDSSGRLVALIGAGGVDKCSPPGSNGDSGFEPTGNEGAAYVYVRDATGTWTLEAELFAADCEKDFRTGGIWDPSYNHGYDAVALDGDVAVLGALGARPVNSSGVRQGSLYSFRRIGTTWIECSRVFASDPRTEARLGLAVGLSGDTAVGVTSVHSGDLPIYVADDVCAGVVPADSPPTADAGLDFSLNEGQTGAVLDGSGSTDPDGDPLSYAWSQIAGTPVSLSDPAAVQPTFDAPLVAIGGETLTFELTVTANGLQDVDTVDATIVNVNHPPVADAGDDQSIAEGSPVTLDGSDSFDVDGDPFTFTWVQIAGSPTVTLSDATAAMPTFTAPLVGSGGAPGVVASLVFELTVDDGFPLDEPAPGYTFANVADRVTIDVTNLNNAPTADAGGDQTVGENSPVSLNGSGSSDPDSDPLTYSWAQTGGSPVTLTGAGTATPSFTAPATSLGGEALTFQLTVDDSYGGTATDEVVVNVQNQNDPPDASLAQPTEACLWPPNHKLVSIGITGVTDPENNATITIDAVCQDEPTNGTGSGDTPIDAFIQSDGTVLLRAERSGNGDGRVYHIHFTASDPEGSDSGVVTVCVPHSKKQSAVDSGQRYDSTQ